METLASNALVSATPALQTRRVKFENFDQEKYIPSELCTNDAESFSPVFFTRFGRPMAKNSYSVLSTGVWPFPYLGTFDQWCN